MKNQSKTVQLLAENGMLCTALDDVLASVRGELFQHEPHNPLLMVRYDAGDCDTIAWPKYDAKNLHHALFDAREMGLIPDVQTVLLPDGKEFAI